MFCLGLLIFGLNRNVLLCLGQNQDQFKLLCFVPEFLGQNRNDLLVIQNLLDQIKMFCFCSISKRTKSKYFAFVPNKLRYRNVCFDIVDITKPVVYRTVLLVVRMLIWRDLSISLCVGSGSGRIRNYLQDLDPQFKFRMRIRKGSGKDPE